MCETPTRSLAIHSQSMDIPKCPENWQELWIGYSFIMVSECVTKIDDKDGSLITDHRSQFTVLSFSVY